MEIVVEAKSYEHAKYCIDKGIKNLILGNELFASRISYNFNESEIQELINNRKDTNIWIKLNRFFFEEEIHRLTMYLNWLSSLEIDKVIFQDYAVCQINKELNLNLNLLYNPETLVTSYGQFPFFQKNNINNVFIARELIWNELATIAQNKEKMKIMIQGFGHGFMMHSRWKLISNFIDHYHLNETTKDYLLIKEKLRKYPNIIFEDLSGTHMLTGYAINTLNLIPKLKALNIDYLLVDFLKLNNNYFNEITDIYQQAINEDKEYKWYEEQYLKVNELINPIIGANGFYDCPKSVLHLEKEEENNE